MPEQKKLKKKSQHSYFEKRCEGVHAALRLFRKTGDPEHLHDLRVEIKKIRALLLLQENSGGKLARHFKLLRRVFKQAGEIRTVQLHLSLMKKYGLASAVLRKEQEQTGAEKTKTFQAEIPRLTKKLKSVSEQLNRKFMDTGAGMLSRVLDSEIQLPANTFSELAIADLHESRKHIKHLLYFQDIIGGSMSAEFEMNREYLDQLQNQIGKWHDAELTLELIREKKIRNAAAVQKLRKDRAGILKKIWETGIDFRKKIRVGPLS